MTRPGSIVAAVALFLTAAGCSKKSTENVGSGDPAWMETIGDVFPLKHFVRAFQDAFSPFTTGSGFRWGSLAVIAAWGLFGMLVAMRTFGWEPRRPSARRRRAAA